MEACMKRNFCDQKAREERKTNYSKEDTQMILEPDEVSHRSVNSMIKYIGYTDYSLSQKVTRLLVQQVF